MKKTEKKADAASLQLGTMRWLFHGVGFRV